MGKRWIEMVEEVIEAMSEADIGYFSDYVWVGNAEVEAWFYPDGVCHVSRDGGIQTIRTQDAGALLVEQPPEELFSERKSGSSGRCRDKLRFPEN